MRLHAEPPNELSELAADRSDSRAIEPRGRAASAATRAAAALCACAVDACDSSTSTAWRRKACGHGGGGA